MIVEGHTIKDISWYFCLVVVEHVIKGFIELIRDFLDLELFTIDLILNVINPVVKFGNIHLSIFIASLGMLEPLHKLVNFVLELLLPLLGLFSRNLKLLHVLTNSFQFLLNISELALSQFSTFIGSLQFLFLNSQFPGKLIQLLLIVACHFGGFSQVFVSLLNLNLIPHGLILKVFDLLQNTISLFGGHGKLGDSLGQVGVCLFGLFLHQHDTSSQSADLFLSILE